MATTTSGRNTRRGATPVRSSRTSSSSAITYVVVNRFQGGITAQADKVQIANGFSPMARNVIWGPIGGIVVRQGVGPLPYGALGEMAATGGTPLLFMHFTRDASGASSLQSQYMVALSDGRVRVGVDVGSAITGTAAGQWADLQVGGSARTTVGPPTMTAWDTHVYLSCGQQATTSLGINMARWDGNNPATALGRAFNDDLTNPVGGNMPPARFTAAWAERFWVAVCLHDSAAIDASMIRWSHPGHPEDWQTNDYINIGQQGDVITGIAPMRDMLVIFKKSSTYALLGSGATNFRVVELSGTIGCTGPWTRDNQGHILFWDGSIGACRFDGKGIVNLFEPLREFLTSQPPAITRCGSIATDGDRVYVLTDFTDLYGTRLDNQVTRGAEPNLEPGAQAILTPGLTTWQDLITNNVTWGQLMASRWQNTAYQTYNIVWVYRDGCGWTSFMLNHPSGHTIGMIGQVKMRVDAAGVIQSNRRVVYGVSDATLPLYLSDRFDDGADHFVTNATPNPIDAFYMTSWLTAGLPAQIKRFKAPRVIQEADTPGVLLISVYYDYNYDFLRRTLRVGVLPDPVHPYSADSYAVGKPGTIGRAKAALLVIRPETTRHWGVSSITIPVHPKVLR